MLLVQAAPTVSLERTTGHETSPATAVCVPAHLRSAFIFSTNTRPGRSQPRNRQQGARTLPVSLADAEDMLPLLFLTIPYVYSVFRDRLCQQRPDRVTCPLTSLKDHPRASSSPLSPSVPPHLTFVQAVTRIGTPS